MTSALRLLLSGEHAVDNPLSGDHHWPIVHNPPYEVSFMLRQARCCWSILAFVVFSFVSTGNAEDPSDQTSAARLSAHTVLNELLAGNERFVNGKSNHPHESAKWRNSIESAQHPKAIILGCADSRVPPEIIFDQGLGDLFVIRVAGNVVDNEVIASIEYAVDHLGTPLVVVLGHTHCGAVTAAFDMDSHPEEPDEIMSLLYRIRPAFKGIPTDADRETQLREAVRRNVERAAQRLRLVPDLVKSLQQEHDLRIVGAVYDLHSGKILLAKDMKAEAEKQGRKDPSVTTVP